MGTRIAIVVQRYGVEVNGGAEQHARMVAERLARVPGYEIEVLTTCALEYTTWENYYPEGQSVVDGVRVRRFEVEKTRNLKSFNRFSRLVFYRGLIGRFLPGIGRLWVNKQGPYCPDIIKYIEENRDSYDVFIFFTYLYYPTVHGITKIRKKAIFVPTAHDEPPIYLRIYKDVFRCPGGIAYNTVEERELIGRLFDAGHIPGDIFGVGVDVPKDANPVRFREKYDIGDYFLYVGRIEDGKNVPELCDFFIRYKAKHPSDIKLVLIGKEVNPPPAHPDIVPLGYVSEQDKTDAMADAKLFLLPSLNESLSMVLLESMSLGVPVIVNGKCKVLRGHCERSGAGLCYEGFEQFESSINRLTSPENTGEYADMKAKAQEYVRENYSWDVIIGKYRKMIEIIKN